MRVTISRRDTADTAITVEVSSLHVSLHVQSFPLSPGTEVGSGIQDTFLWVYIFDQHLPFVVEGSTVPERRVVMSAALCVLLGDMCDDENTVVDIVALQVSRVGEKKYPQTAAFDHEQYHTPVSLAPRNLTSPT